MPDLAVETPDDTDLISTTRPGPSAADDDGQLPDQPGRGTAPDALGAIPSLSVENGMRVGTGCERGWF
jgi:hypothetical protein